MSHRIKLQPGWVLHRRDFRDSSQIVDVLTPEQGRLSMVARGIKRPKSRHRGLLQPFSPLLLSWSGSRDLVTMTDVERGVGPVLALSGEHLLSGFYVNELMLRLTHRHDPQPELFSLYSETVESLAAHGDAATALRDFEFKLLSVLGFGLNLTRDAATGAAVEHDAQYTFAIDQGPSRCDVAALGEPTVSGAALLAMASRDWSRAETRREARLITTRAIDWHLDGKPLQSRRVLRHLRRTTATTQQAEE
ncbi:MAG: DNA repair protein RecO [Pseudomonadota bacterium]